MRQARFSPQKNWNYEFTTTLKKIRPPPVIILDIIVNQFHIIVKLFQPKKMMGYSNIRKSTIVYCGTDVDTHVHISAITNL